jgi:hypothetical protein
MRERQDMRQENMPDLVIWSIKKTLFLWIGGQIFILDNNLVCRTGVVYFVCSVYLVHLVHLVYLVDFAYLVSSVKGEKGGTSKKHGLSGLFGLSGLSRPYKNAKSMGQRAWGKAKEAKKELIGILSAD